jgi:hypothetical protein
LNGYGVQLVPYWPYRFERLDSGASARVRIVRVTSDGEYDAHIDPADPVAVQRDLILR